VVNSIRLAKRRRGRGCEVGGITRVTRGVCSEALGIVASDPISWMLSVPRNIICMFKKLFTNSLVRRSNLRIIRRCAAFDMGPHF
jgi:hypothetical protein